MKNSFEVIRHYESLVGVSKEGLIKLVKERWPHFGARWETGTSYWIFTKDEYWDIINQWCDYFSKNLPSFVAKAHTCIEALYGVGGGTSDLKFGGVMLGSFTDPCSPAYIAKQYTDNFIACCCHLMQKWQGRGDAAECHEHLVYSFRGGVGGTFGVSYHIEKYAQDKFDKVYQVDRQPISANIMFRFRLESLYQPMVNFD